MATDVIEELEMNAKIDGEAENLLVKPTLKVSSELGK